MFADVFVRLLDLLCPAICPVCGNVSDSGGLICPSCEEKMVTASDAFCRRCGAKRHDGKSDEPDCLRCRNTAFRFRRAVALGDYETDLRTLVLKMKKEKNGYTAIDTARLLVKHRRSELTASPPDLVTAVPMFKRRRRYRGVNSPDIIAAEIARQLKIPLALSLVSRIRSTHVQHSLSPAERRENVSEAFDMNTPGWFRSVPNVKGKHILLVDDILTTASTCCEVSNVLLKAGAKTITAAVIARAGHRLTFILD
ncbi:MAG: double zinc ribbon domain-containing protein [Planctomycetaceae bacterium]|jgi:ComF family protein|nr:double zinc ribbon domain-containing protein [Planctomycetaceae bacterium]